MWRRKFMQSLKQIRDRSTAIFMTVQHAVEIHELRLRDSYESAKCDPKAIDLGSVIKWEISIDFSQCINDTRSMSATIEGIAIDLPFSLWSFVFRERLMWSLIFWITWKDSGNMSIGSHELNQIEIQRIYRNDGELCGLCGNCGYKCLSPGRSIRSVTRSQRSSCQYSTKEWLIRQKIHTYSELSEENIGALLKTDQSGLPGCDGGASALYAATFSLIWIRRLLPIAWLDQ